MNFSTASVAPIGWTPRPVFRQWSSTSRRLSRLPSSVLATWIQCRSSVAYCRVTVFPALGLEPFDELPALWSCSSKYFRSHAFPDSESFTRRTNTAQRPSERSVGFALTSYRHHIFPEKPIFGPFCWLASHRISSPRNALILSHSTSRGSAYGTRTRAPALRGPCPNRLDERARAETIQEFKEFRSSSREFRKAIFLEDFFVCHELSLSPRG